MKPSFINRLPPLASLAIVALAAAVFFFNALVPWWPAWSL